MKELLTKLAAVKREIGVLSKNASNPFYKSKYLDLNEILTHLEPLLDKHGLILIQPITGDTVCTEIHDIETGQNIQSCINLPVLNDPQKTGSCISYFRRYGLQSLLSLQSEDDDANRASVKEPVKVAKETLTEAHPLWGDVCKAITEGKRTIEQVKAKFLVDKKTEQILLLLNK